MFLATQAHESGHHHNPTVRTSMLWVWKREGVFDIHPTQFHCILSALVWGLYTCKAVSLSDLNAHQHMHVFMKHRT